MEGFEMVNLTFQGVAVKLGMPLAVLAAATALTATALSDPIRPPRSYASGAGSAVVVHLDNVPSDSPIIRD
jgi:hypothetical protein